MYACFIPIRMAMPHTRLDEGSASFVAELEGHCRPAFDAYTAQDLKLPQEGVAASSCLSGMPSISSSLKSGSTYRAGLRGLGTFSGRTSCAGRLEVQLEVGPGEPDAEHLLEIVGLDDRRGGKRVDLAFLQGAGLDELAGLLLDEVDRPWLAVPSIRSSCRRRPAAAHPACDWAACSTCSRDQSGPRPTGSRQ